MKGPLSLALGALLLATAVAPAPAMADDRRGWHDRGDRREHRRDHREFQRDRREFRDDRREWRDDRREWQSDRREWRRDDRAYHYDRRHHDRPRHVVHHAPRHYYSSPRPVVVHHYPRYTRGYHYGYRGYRPTYVVHDYGYYNLRHPPRGYGWRRSDAGDFLMVALATGIIAEVISR